MTPSLPVTEGIPTTVVIVRAALLFGLWIAVDQRFTPGNLLVGGLATVAATALSLRLPQAISHATAKAGMAMAARLVDAAFGLDRIAELAGVDRVAMGRAAADRLLTCCSGWRRTRQRCRPGS